MTFLDSNNNVLTPGKGSINQRRPRICMFTTRGFARNVFRCGSYESQDILIEVDDVDLIYLKPRKARELRERFQQCVVWHDFTKKIVTMNLAYETIRLTKAYDLFIAYLPHRYDLLQVSAIRGWKDCCETSVLWIDEMWAVHVPKLQAYFPLINQFDHVAVGLKQTANIISNTLKRPCHWVPGGVDALLFSPYPKQPSRVIDIYNIGRTVPAIHHALSDYSNNKGLFYVHDTFDNASDIQAKGCRLHRTMFANMVKRSRYFLVAPAKMDATHETSGQIDVGFRYYEGSAGGAVMIGQTPDCESFQIIFDWPDSVIDIQPDGSDVAEVLENLSSQPERIREISRRNAGEALLRHDWVYRWEKIFNIVGLKPKPELKIRKDKLKRMADKIRNLAYNSVK